MSCANDTRAQLYDADDDDAGGLFYVSLREHRCQPQSAAAGNFAILMVVGYMFAFGASWGYGAWLYIPEIMPLRVRGGDQPRGATLPSWQKNAVQISLV